MKRAFDVLFSLIGLAVFLVPGLIIACCNLLIERHPVFFYQERTGKNRRPFRIIKFQTMLNNQPTSTGRILRATGLDEVPQFLNVLKGDMSIVGPRALTKADVIRLGWDDPFHDCRWHVKPGITGFAQLYGGQNKRTSWFWDNHYLHHQNLFMDFCVLLISFLMNVFGKRPVRRFIFQKIHLR